MPDEKEKYAANELVRVLPEPDPANDKLIDDLQEQAKPRGDRLQERVDALEKALNEIIQHCELHSDGSWAQDEPEMIARRALGIE